MERCMEARRSLLRREYGLPKNNQPIFVFKNKEAGSTNPQLLIVARYGAAGVAGQTSASFSPAVLRHPYGLMAASSAITILNPLR